MNASWKNLIKPGLALLLIVIGCAVAARFLSGQETLADYAEKNPELAYGSHDDEDDDPVSPESEEEAAIDDKTSDVIHNAEITPSIPDPAPDPSAIVDGSDEGESVSPEDTDTALETDSSDMAGTGGSTDTASTAASQADAADTAGTGTTDEVSSAASNAETAATASSSASTASSGSTEDSERIVYKDGFFQEKITESVKIRITGVSYPEDCPVSLDVLRYLNVKYVDFFGNDQNGEIICNERIAQELLEIFYELYTIRYPIESIRLVDDYGGDDTASMVANNTSCFNYRTVEGSTNLSRHALGLAIDVNPLYNPWINYNSDGTYTVSPEISADYADRTKDFEHKIDENDECYKLFAERDFFWGGFWNNPDYQHFQKN